MGSALAVEVIYIAFGPYGLAPVENFLRSYRAYAAGHDHRLTIALKEFGDPAHRAIVADYCRHEGGTAIDVPGGGYDIGTYLHAASRSRADMVCLMNSHSEVLAEAWLGKLVDALRDQGGGAVGATGSWESHVSDQLRALPGHPPRLGQRLRRMPRLFRHYPLFPNIHLRTNALAIDRAELLGFGFRAPIRKEEAWRFESGRAGLSGTLLRRGRPIRLVGRDGRAFPPRQWDRSDIFWQGQQANLLVADNQTRRFAQGNTERRASLQALAWQAPRPERAAEQSRWNAL